MEDNELDYIRSKIREHSTFIRQQQSTRYLNALVEGPPQRDLSLNTPTGLTQGTSVQHDTLGNVTAFVGQTNMLDDPTFESFEDGWSPTGSPDTTGRWTVESVVNSGTINSVLLSRLDFRENAGDNPFNSDQLGVSVSFNAGAGNADVYIYPAADLTPVAAPSLPFLVVASRIAHNIYGIGADIDVLTATMEIYDVDSSVVVAASDPFDIYSLEQNYEAHQISAAMESSPGAVRIGTWRWRFKLHVEKANTGLTTVAGVTIGEPQMHLAYTPDPMAFVPLIGAWSPSSADYDWAWRGESLNNLITTDQNDYDPSGLSSETILHVTPGGAGPGRTITGLAGGALGRLILLVNGAGGANTLTLTHESGSSIAGNRFWCPNGLSVVLQPYENAILIYDEINVRWRVFTHSIAASATSFGAPALTLSTSNAAGAAATAIRTDATVAVFDATVPVTQASADAAATGSAGTAARRDHRHGMPTLAAVGSGIVDTTPLADSANGASATAARVDHTHQSPGGIASITSNQSTGLSTTEKQIVAASLPANFMAAGTTFRVEMHGAVTVAVGGAVTFRVRIGTTTLTGNIPVSVAPNSSSAQNFMVNALVTIRTAGASGTATGEMMITQGGTPAFTGTTVSAIRGATVTVDTTATKIIEATIQLGNAGDTVIVYVASIEVVKM